jgi:hypothetical protein
MDIETLHWQLRAARTTLARAQDELKAIEDRYSARLAELEEKIRQLEFERDWIPVCITKPEPNQAVFMLTTRHIHLAGFTNEDGVFVDTNHHYLPEGEEVVYWLPVPPEPEPDPADRHPAIDPGLTY